MSTPSIAAPPVASKSGEARESGPIIIAWYSTFNNLGSPEEYAAYAVECKNLGYTAYKIHSHYYWDPATRQAAPPRPSHVEWDIKTCHAVREADGEEMVPMYDPWGTYNTYADAIRVGRVLEELDFYWYEHPMPEHKVASYIRLAEELTIPICSPGSPKAACSPGLTGLPAELRTSAGSMCCEEASPVP